MHIVLILVSILLLTVPARADWVIFMDGQRTEVQAVEITERAVHLTTRTGKRWSVLRSVVDVERTRAANGRVAEPPLEVVGIQPSPQPTTPERAAPEPLTKPPPRTPVRVPAHRPPPPPRPKAPPPPPPASSRRTEANLGRPPPRFSVSLNGALGSEAFQLSDVNRFELFKEPAQIESVYRDPRRSQGIELEAQYRFAGPLAVSGAVERFRNDRNAAFRASLPHPFFFDRFRELSGTESGLTYEETALHLDGVFTKTWGAFTFDAFGGPSWFATRTEILTSVLYDETFPFNEVVFEGVEARVFDSRPFGYNAGGAATVRIAGIFGVDFRVRYTRARTQVILDDGRAIALEAGGLRLGAGLRFLFP